MPKGIEHEDGRTIVLMTHGVVCAPFYTPEGPTGPMGMVGFKEGDKSDLEPSSEITTATFKGVMVVGKTPNNFRMAAKCFLDVAKQMEHAAIAEKEKQNGQD